MPHLRQRQSDPTHNEKKNHSVEEAQNEHNRKVSLSSMLPPNTDNNIQQARHSATRKVPEIVFASDGRRFFPCTFCCRAFAYKSHQMGHIKSCSFKTVKLKRAAARIAKLNEAKTLLPEVGGTPESKECDGYGQIMKLDATSPVESKEILNECIEENIETRKITSMETGHNMVEGSPKPRKSEQRTERVQPRKEINLEVPLRSGRLLRSLKPKVTNDSKALKWDCINAQTKMGYIRSGSFEMENVKHAAARIANPNDTKTLLPEGASTLESKANDGNGNIVKLDATSPVESSEIFNEYVAVKVETREVTLMETVNNTVVDSLIPNNSEQMILKTTARNVEMPIPSAQLRRSLIPKANGNESKTLKLDDIDLGHTKNCSFETENMKHAAAKTAKLNKAKTLLPEVVSTLESEDNDRNGESMKLNVTNPVESLEILNECIEGKIDTSKKALKDSGNNMVMGSKPKQAMEKIMLRSVERPISSARLLRSLNPKVNGNDSKTLKLDSIDGQTDLGHTKTFSFETLNLKRSAAQIAKMNKAKTLPEVASTPESKRNNSNGVRMPVKSKKMLNEFIEEDVETHKITMMETGHNTVVGNLKPDKFEQTNEKIMPRSPETPIPSARLRRSLKPKVKGNNSKTLKLGHDGAQTNMKTKTSGTKIAAPMGQDSAKSELEFSSDVYTFSLNNNFEINVPNITYKKWKQFGVELDGASSPTGRDKTDLMGNRINVQNGNARQSVANLEKMQEDMARIHKKPRTKKSDINRDVQLGKNLSENLENGDNCTGFEDILSPKRGNKRSLNGLIQQSAIEMQPKKIELRKPKAVEAKELEQPQLQKLTENRGRKRKLSVLPECAIKKEPKKKQARTKAAKPPKLNKQLNNRANATKSKSKSSVKTAKKLQKSTSKSNKKILQHIPVQDFLEKNKCAHCQEVYYDSETLLNHQCSFRKYPRVHMPPKELQKYIEIFKNTDRTQCTVCSKPTSGNWRRHFVAHSMVKMFACKICKKQFTRVDHKNNHESRHIVTLDT